MKKFDLISFTDQLSHSRCADGIVSHLGQIDRLAKFAIQHCECQEDYFLVHERISSYMFDFEKFIKKFICNEHTENIEDSTDSSSDN